MHVQTALLSSLSSPFPHSSQHGQNVFCCWFSYILAFRQIKHQWFFSHLRPPKLVASSISPHALNDQHHFLDTPLPMASGMTRYGQSKLANVLHIKTLNKLYGPGSPSSKLGNGELWTATLHPGLVDTQLAVGSKEIPRVLKIAVDIYSAFGGRVDADKGSYTSLSCVASPEMEESQSGTYFQMLRNPDS